MTTLEASIDSAPHPTDPAARLLVLTFFATWAAQVCGLYFNAEVFGNGDGWVRRISYESTGDRIGLIAVVGLFSAAVCGLWWILAPRGLRWLLRRGHERSHVTAAALWLTIVQVDYYFRDEISEIAGGGFGFAEFEGGAGGLDLILHRIWHWFGWTVLWGLGQSLVVLIVLLKVLRWVHARDPAPRLRIVERVPIRCALLAFTGSLLFSTLGTRAWPTTAVVVEHSTLVGRLICTPVKVVSDVDGDGWSSFDVPPDPEPLDASIHPHAVDVPGDGIDQDALLGDLVLDEVPASVRAEVEAMASYPPVTFTSRRNIIVVILESVRHSALSEEVDGRIVMPELRAMIANGALSCPDFHAARGFTLPSIGNLLWGGFARSETTLIDDFAANGYETLALSGYDLETEGLIEMGLGATDYRFDAGDVNPGRNPETLPARAVLERIEQVLRSRDPARPFFMFVHLKDPHFPYRADNELVMVDRYLADGEIGPDRRDHIRRCYLNQVHHVDQACGRLIGALKANALADDTTVIFVADHGESIYEDGRSIGHGTALNDAMMRCAMVVWNPRYDLATTMSHAHLRQYIRDTLVAPTTSPKLRPIPERTLLQYLSSTHQPSKIGSFRVTHDDTGRRLFEQRLVYDFSTNLLWDETANEGGPFDASRLNATLHARGSDLIRSWQYMRYANRNNRPY